jgi:hypothetical protein
MIKEEDYLKAKQIVQEYEKQLNISGVIPSLPKIRVHYATEFGGQITTLELDELISFTKRFKILSINWQ